MDENVTAGLLARQERGRQIAASTRLTQAKDNLWIVPSQSLSGPSIPAEVRCIFHGPWDGSKAENASDSVDEIHVGLVVLGSHGLVTPRVSPGLALAHALGSF
jgi:hypothetical protein